jgi:hypothetical protein
MTRIYRNIKTGGNYLFVMNATCESDGTAIVVYQSVDNGKVWTRPAAEFFDTERFVQVA